MLAKPVSSKRHRKNARVLKLLRVADKRVFHELLDEAVEVAVDPALSTGTHPNRRFPRLCYKRAWDYISRRDIAGAQLVHGTVTDPGTGLVLGHAWVVLPGDVIFDGVVQRFFGRESYNRVMNARPIISLEKREAAKRIRTERHYGAWFDLKHYGAR
jgi:hypothetical protein